MARTDVRTARALVGGQFLLLGLLVLLPRGEDWPVPPVLAGAFVVTGAAGLAVMVVGATALGRGLTAIPLPNARAQLRTGGLYRFVRHPIYAGLLLLAGSIAGASGSWAQILVLGLLVLLLAGKARWEERRLAERFEGYAAYAARTPQFLPFRLRP